MQVWNACLPAFWVSACRGLFVMLRIILDKIPVTCHLSTTQAYAVSMTLAVCCRQSKDLDPMWAPLPPGLHLRMAGAEADLSAL